MTRAEELHERAQAYVDSALEKQRRFGHEPNLSDEDYREAVDRAAEGLAGLTNPEETPDEDPVPA